MYEDDDRRRRKSPFDAFDDLFDQMGMDPAEFDRMFREMHRSLMEAMRSQSSREPGRPFVQGFSFKMDADGRPRFEHFGDRAPQAGPEGMRLSDEREPLTDVIESEKELAVTLEIPGVEKDDIKIDAKPERLEISVDNEKRKYHKIVRLPTKADPTTTNATYRNGVLDITVQKLDDSEEGVRVQVQ